MTRSIGCLLAIVLLVRSGFAEGYLEPGKRLESPDKEWEAWVIKREEADNFRAELHLARKGSSHSTLLATNGRHFGAEWSPDSKALLVYDNLGSGTSDAILFSRTAKGWKNIEAAPTGFHVVWRAERWLPGKVILRSYPGGSGAEKRPPTITLSYPTLLGCVR